LKDRLVFHYYHDDTTADDDEITALQPNLWLGPKVAEPDLQSYGNFNESVDAFIRSNKNADGIVGCGVTDPSQLDGLALLAFHGWEPVEEMPYGKIMQRWSQVRFGASAEVFFHAVKDLSDAWHLPEIAVCQQMQYCSPDENSKAWPRPYPEEALIRLEGMSDAGKVLAEAAKTAQEVITGLRGLLNNDKLTPGSQECVNSLIGDALHLQTLANIFSWLLALRRDLADDGAKKANFTSCEELCDSLVDAIKQFETLKPTWMIPYTLQTPSYLLIYLRQLFESLKAQVNHKKGAAIAWSLPNDWQVPEN